MRSAAVMISRLTVWLGLALGLAGCGDFPRDAEGTLDRIRAEREFHIGIIAPGPAGADLGKQRLFIRQVAAKAGARPIVETAAAEPLLKRLEEGEIDLVIGEMSAVSPWSKQVTLLPPLVPASDEPAATSLSALARNGENGWIGLLHGEAVAIGGGS